MAHFVPASCERQVERAAQRTLLLEGFDLARHHITGYGNLDRKPLETRARLRATSAIGQRELAEALILAAPIADLAGLPPRN